MSSGRALRIDVRSRFLVAVTPPALRFHGQLSELSQIGGGKAHELRYVTSRFDRE
jgi:hypothetical protein